MPHKLAGLLRVLLAASALILLVPTVRHLLESRMAFHMLIEFPLLFVSGYQLKTLLAARWKPVCAWLAPWNGMGISGLVFASCVFAFWMIPAALDAALLEPLVATAKYLSWWLAGMAVAGSVAAARPELMIFFTGNAAWMSATAGMLYLESTSRLCVNYLIGDQLVAGWGLILLAILLIGMAVWFALFPDKVAHGATQSSQNELTVRV